MPSEMKLAKLLYDTKTLTDRERLAILYAIQRVIDDEGDNSAWRKILITLNG